MIVTIENLLCVISAFLCASAVTLGNSKITAEAQRNAEITQSDGDDE